MRAWIPAMGVIGMTACGGSPGASSADPAHEVRRTSAAFSFSRLDKVDLLFVIDNSNSMTGEQAQLRMQFPRLMEALTTGLRSTDDTRPFTPVRDLHVAVVSTDMGIPGVELRPSCHADGGDDGRLLNRVSPDTGLTCADSYPLFLTYQAGQSDPRQLAQDFACVATLGTGGCGFEQQLEAPLKALTPRVLLDEQGQPSDVEPVRFLATEQARTWGRGDLDPQRGGNFGFLRNDPNDPSLLVVVLMTDEEDCSVASTEHLKPNNQLPEDSPFRMEDINLRCFYHPELNHSIERYVDGFRALRPGREDLVVFSAIAGVPADLVSSEVIASTDFEDENARSSFYDNILDDPRMTLAVDPSTELGTGKGNLLPSCVRAPLPGEVVPSTAYPPRRIVELARAFGPNGMVQSICQDDFGPAIDMLVDTMAKPLTEMCMPQKLIRGDDDRVSCALVWQLPTAEQVEEQMLDASTPTDCAALGELLDASRPTQSDQHCAIRQLPVRDGAVADGGDGWYYDDFTPGLDAMCAEGLPQRIAFTDGARPPRGVAAKLECDAGAQQTP
jgi:hypothetical protein